MSYIRWFILTPFFIFSIPISFVYSAQEEVHQVGRDGTIQLKNGKMLSLAGLILSEEAGTILTPLIGNKSVEIVREPNRYARVDQEKEPVYIYVRAREMNFGNKGKRSIKEQKMMVNELLLKVGAAWVDAEKSFRYKEEFMRFEQQAKTEGQGVWSYVSTQA